MGKLIFIVVAVLLGGGGLTPRVSYSQDVRKPKPTNCEYNIAILDSASNLAGQDGLVIVVAHRGISETRGDLNTRRLKNIKTYLTQFAKRDPASIILAQGEAVDGHGVVKLYVKGKLYSSIYLFRNKDIAVGQCSFDGMRRCSIPSEQMFYPCRK